eukprot:8213253-Pyramimonas_sp.AAC.1
MTEQHDSSSVPSQGVNTCPAFGWGGWCRESAIRLRNREPAHRPGHTIRARRHQLYSHQHRRQRRRARTGPTLQEMRLGMGDTLET